MSPIPSPIITSTEKVKFILKEPNTSKESLLYLIYRYNNTRFKYSTELKICPSDWHFSNQRALEEKGLKNISKNKFVNKKLNEIKSSFDKVIEHIEYQHITFDNQYLKDELDILLDRKIRGNKSKEENEIVIPNFIEYADIFYNQLEKGERLTDAGKKYKKSSLSSYKSLIGHLRDFNAENKSFLKFSDIDMTFYKELIVFFNKQNKALNTVGKYIKNIKTIMRAAFEENLHQNLEVEKKKFKTLKENVSKIYLTEIELEKIYNLDLKSNTRLEKIRDLFIIESYTALRFSDLHNLKKDNIFQTNKGTFIRFYTQKTNTEIIAPLKPMLIDIFIKYEWTLPRIITNQKMNDYLKEIGELAEINSKYMFKITKGGNTSEVLKMKWELISTHTARRSAATNMYLSMVPTHFIMKLTGHKKESTFLNYIKADAFENAEKLAEFDFFNK